MTTTHRRRRGAETQAALAAFLRANGFPYATDAGAGRGGTDILNTLGVTWEAKSTREFSHRKGAAQAAGHGGEQTPAVIRPDGYGVARVGAWPVCVPLDQYVRLLRMAGYGSPLEDAQTPERPRTPDGTPKSAHGDAGGRDTPTADEGSDPGTAVEMDPPGSRRTAPPGLAARPAARPRPARTRCNDCKGLDA